MVEKMEEQEHEVWKWVLGYEGLYQVSDLGKLKSFYRNREQLLNSRITKCGYRRAKIRDRKGNDKNVFVHRLVLLAFVGYPEEGQQTCHNNGNRLDNRLSNLRWGTAKENSKDKEKHGTKSFGEDVGVSVLTEEVVVRIREDYASGNYTYKQLSKKYNTSEANLAVLLTNRTWKHVGGPTKDITWKRKLDEQSAADIRTLFHTGNYTKSLLAGMYGVSIPSISAVLSGKCYKNAGGPDCSKMVRGSKLTAEKVKDIRALHASGEKTKSELSKLYDVAYQTIRGIILGHNWKNV